MRRRRRELLQIVSRNGPRGGQRRSCLSLEFALAMPQAAASISKKSWKASLLTRIRTHAGKVITLHVKTRKLRLQPRTPYMCFRSVTVCVIFAGQRSTPRGNCFAAVNVTRRLQYISRIHQRHNAQWVNQVRSVVWQRPSRACRACRTTRASRRNRPSRARLDTRCYRRHPTPRTTMPSWCKWHG